MTEKPDFVRTNPQSLPAHVAIIMDGNGRWARSRGLPREEGHRQGVENVRRIMAKARELEVKYLTLFAFSVENWHRPKSEVGALMRLLESFLKARARELMEKGIRLRVLGRLEEMPPRIARLVEKVVADTASFDQWHLSLALNYGSRTELIDAVKACAEAVRMGTEDPDTLTFDSFRKYLYTSDLPDPDMVIRTSGEHRVSNFLLLQSAYAEYYFAEDYWPDFGPEAFETALRAYSRRERRFGLTAEQIQSSVS